MVNLGSATANKVLFGAFMVVYVGTALYFIPRIYGRGFGPTYLVALIFGSAGFYTFVMRVWEHRWPWPLGGMYASFWVNDVFVLTLVAGALSVMHRSLPDDWHDPSWWPWVALGIALLAGVWFMWGVDGKFPAAAFWSPSHVAHGFGSYVILSYLLLRGAPGLLRGSYGFPALAHGNVLGIAMVAIVVVGLVAFMAMYPVVDLRWLHTWPWNTTGYYDWDHLRLTYQLTQHNPGFIPEPMRGFAPAWYRNAA